MELHSCAGLQMPLGRAVLTAQWLGMVDAIRQSRLTICSTVGDWNGVGSDWHLRLGVATGSYGKLHWRGGDWRALGAALAGWRLAGSGSCSGGRDYKAAREHGILDR